MQETGIVQSVYTTELGSELSAATLAGAMSLTVEDGADFAEDGGNIIVGTEVKGYSAFDDETGVMTLDSDFDPLPGLQTAYPAGTRVRLWPITVEKFADVQIDNEDETIEVRIPAHLWDHIPDGTRDDATSESVALDYNEDDEFVLADILGAAPRTIFETDTGEIDLEESIYNIGGPDGQAPANSPTLTLIGGIGVLHVRWTQVPNFSTVIYDVYMGTVSGFTKGPATLIGETTSNAYTIRADAAGAPLLNGVTYYVAVIARDEDGSAAPSVEVSGSTVLITTDDIAADQIWAGKINAADIISGTVGAEILIGGRFTTRVPDPVTGQTEGSGIDVTPGGGIEVFDATGVATTVFPTNGDPSTFRGEVVAGTVTANAGVNLFQQSLGNAEGTFKMLSGPTEPKTGPVASIGWNSLQLGGANVVGACLGRVVSTVQRTAVLRHNPAVGGTAATYSITEYDNAGTAHTTYTLPYQFGSGTVYTTYQAVSIAYDGTYYLVLWKGPQAGVTGNPTTHILIRVNAATGAYVSFANISESVGQAHSAAVFYDNAASMIIYAQRLSTGSSSEKVVFRRFTWASTLNLASNVFSNTLEPFGDLAGVYYGPADFGTNIHVTSSGSAVHTWRTYSATGVADTGKEWPKAAGSSRAIWWNGTTWYSIDVNGKRSEYTGTTWTTAANGTWWATYGWHNSTGPVRTPDSPKTKFTMTKRARVQLVGTEGAPLGATHGEFFLGVGTTTPADAALFSQGLDPVTTGEIPSLIVTTRATSGANPVTVNGFPSGTPFKLESTTAGGFSIDGLGNGSVGVGTFRDSVRTEARTGVGGRVAFGNGTYTTNVNGDITITHGLGVVPDSISHTPGTFGFYRVLAGFTTSTQFVLRCADVAGTARGSGVSITMHWQVFAT